MTRRKFPEADGVVNDTFGPACRACGGVVILDKVIIRNGEMVRSVYRHVESRPPCLNRVPA